MTARLLALDLDGTLLQRDGSIHPHDLAAVTRLLSAGVAVTLCTGRLYSGTRNVALALALDGPVGCVDGSQVMLHTASGARTLDNAGIQGEHALRLRELLARRELGRFFAAGDRIVHDPGGARFVPYVGTWTGVLEETDDLHGHSLWEGAEGLLAAIVVGARADIELTAAEIRAELSAHAQLFSFSLTQSPGMGAMIVRAAGRSKGTALRAIGAHYGIDVKDIVAVGDWFNDQSMFEVAGRSFAMRTAPESLRVLATDHVQRDLADGGVAEVIERAFA